jgi:GH24 family phage-related lysozyme (muramidase)
MPKTYPIGKNDKLRDEKIKFFEESGKFSSKAYLDTEGLPTIGWGNRFHRDGREVKLGDTITQEEADKLYNEEVTKHVQALRETKNFDKFNPNQQAALESFAYNAGPNFLSTSGWETISAAIKAGDVEATARALPMYNNSGVLTGRRQAELAVYNTPYEEPKPKVVKPKPQAVQPKPKAAPKPKPKTNPKPNPIIEGLRILKKNIPSILTIR